MTGISYYRLVQADNNGDEKTYGPISVPCMNGGNSITVFPNPAAKAFTVEISSLEHVEDAMIRIIDLTGKLISTHALNILEGKNQVVFEGESLQMGTYIVNLVSRENQFKPVRVVIN